MKFMLLFLITFILSACAPVTAQFVQLPDTEKLGVTALVVAVSSFVFVQIGTLIPWTSPFISKYKDEIAASIAAVIVGVIENSMPSAYPDVSILIVQLILAALATVGIFKALEKSGAPGFRS
jgi:hypothetical protein